jgi:hypothetical protein
MYVQGKQMVSVSRNISHLVLFSLIRDGQMLRNLAREVFPGNAGLLLDAHKQATEKRFGYLVLDLHPYCDPTFRMRTAIFSVSSFLLVFGKSGRYI